MSDRPQHVLNVLYDETFKSEQKLARYTAEGWEECVEEEQKRLNHWKLLYDAVDGGLLDDLAAAAEALESRMAVAS